MPASSQSIPSEEIHAAIDRLATAINERHRLTEKLLLLGIANGGIPLARRLAALIPHARLGSVDISFHRDDIGRHPIPKEYAPTQIPGDVNGAAVILVDDVLFSGRTVKAALDEIFDHGRPATVELAVLVDRAGRRLPIAADYCGLNITATAQQKVLVTLDGASSSRDAVRIEPTPSKTKA